MALNKQQQDTAWWAGAGAGLLIGLFLFYQLYYAPKQAALDAITKQTKQLQINKDLIKNAKEIDPMWGELQSLGLQSDPTQVQKLITDRIYSLSAGSQLNIDNLNFDSKPTLIAKMPNFSDIKCSLRVTATTTSLGRFLYAVELARLPMKIDAVTVQSRKEGTDDLTVSMNISALVYTPKAAAKPGPATMPVRTGRSGTASARAGATQPARAATTQAGDDKLIAERLAAKRASENGPAPTTAPAATPTAPKGGN